MSLLQTVVIHGCAPSFPRQSTPAAQLVLILWSTLFVVDPKDRHCPSHSPAPPLSILTEPSNLTYLTPLFLHSPQPLSHLTCLTPLFLHSPQPPSPSTTTSTQTCNMINRHSAKMVEVGYFILCIWVLIWEWGTLLCLSVLQCHPECALHEINESMTNAETLQEQGETTFTWYI